MAGHFGLPVGPRTVFEVWWSQLTRETAGGSARADRATLRRAHSPTAVACTAAYQRVYREMAMAHDGPPWSEGQRERVAALVGLAAHVKERSSFSLPQAMGQRAEGGERNAVSELRFRRLLDAPDIDALFDGLRRVLPLIDHRVNLSRLADDVFAWGDVVKKNWAYEYQWPAKSQG